MKTADRLVQGTEDDNFMHHQYQNIHYDMQTNYKNVALIKQMKII